MSNEKATSLTVKFWAPYTAPYASATSSVEIKAPEEGNKEKRSRNQSIARTRAGNVLVYDRGTNYNTNFSLDFKEIVDIDRAQLLVFLETIQWATTKICYQDMYGDIYIVRILQDTGIEYEDRGTDLKKGMSRIRWNFSLALLNLTDNLAELAIADGNVSNALSLHLTNYNDPHNPDVRYIGNTVDGAKIVESYYTTDWKTVIFTVQASNGVNSGAFQVAISHNRNGATIATTVVLQQATLVQNGTVASALTFTADLSGAGVLQLMRLKLAVSSNGWDIRVRRLKLGPV